MDFTAVRMATDGDFQALGLVRRGDILALRSFVPSTDKAKEERKFRLLKLTHLLGTTSRKSKAASSRGKSCPSDDCPQSPPCKKTQTSKKIQIGWQHYSENEKRYVSVRLVKGGGTREISVPIESSYVEVLRIMKDVYFPDGMSTFGDEDIMTFKVGNFKAEEVQEQYTLAKYIAKYKLTKVRLYLLTRIIDDNDSELLKPVFDNGQDTVSDGLLGTSDERNSLREDRDKEYLDSLRKDQEKEQAKQEELLRRQEESAIQESLREAREMRVPAEPDISEVHVKVPVRHVTLGVITRKFPKSGHVGTVYDWMGSLSLTPEYFSLSMIGSMDLNPALPIETVDQVSMHECDESPPFPDEMVCLHGFGAPSEMPSEDNMWEPVSEKPPLVLLEDDEEKDTPSGSSEDNPVAVERSSIDSAGRRFREVVNSL